jgi:hypothetical protein
LVMLLQVIIRNSINNLKGKIDRKSIDKNELLMYILLKYMGEKFTDKQNIPNDLISSEQSTLIAEAELLIIKLQFNLDNCRQELKNILGKIKHCSFDFSHAKKSATQLNRLLNRLEGIINKPVEIIKSKGEVIQIESRAEDAETLVQLEDKAGNVRQVYMKNYRLKPNNLLYTGAKFYYIKKTLKDGSVSIQCFSDKSANKALIEELRKELKKYKEHHEKAFN